MCSLLQTVIEKIIRDKVELLMIEKPENAPILFRVMRRIRAGNYRPKTLVDAIFQRNDPINIYETWCFAQIWAALVQGRVGTAWIRVSDSPFSNADIDHNNTILAHLPAPYRAEFSPKQSGDDGFVEWSEPITLQGAVPRHSPADDRQPPLPGTFRAEPRSIPLEVGYTSAEKTYEHLFIKNGALARFPYESNHIVILYNRRFEEEFAQHFETDMMNREEKRGRGNLWTT